MSEKQQMRDTDNWPQYPKLPVKKRIGNGMPALGYILAGEVESDGPITLRPVNFRLCPKTEQQQFADLDALLEAGWVGD